MSSPRLRRPSIPPAWRDKLREMDSRANHWMTPVVKWTVYLCVALFLLRVFLPLPAWLSLFAASPHGTVFRARIWQLLTYALLHDNQSLFHVLFNLLGMWFFGVRLERAWGSTRFLRLWIATAAGAALTHIVVTIVFVSTGLLLPNEYHNAMIGLSGVVYGVLTVYALLHPHETVYVFGVLPVKVGMLVVVLGVMAFLGSLGGPSPVGHLGHLGGILFGWLFLRFPNIFDRIPVPRMGHRRWRPPEPSPRPRWRPPEG